MSQHLIYKKKCQSVELFEGFKWLNVLGAKNNCIEKKAQTGLEQNGNIPPEKLFHRQLSEERFHPLSVSEWRRQLVGQNARSAVTIMSS